MTLTSKDPILGNAVLETLAMVVSGFIALTSILGGILLISGLENDNLGLDILKGTPFTDFFIPGILLIAIIGSSSTLALLGFIMNVHYKDYLGIISGLIVSVWIIIEISLLNQPSATIIEIIYLFSGILLVILSFLLFSSQRKGKN